MVAVLFNAGLQVPFTPFVDVVGKAFNAAPAQIGATGANAGVSTGFTTIVIVAGTAHCPAVGVNVYVVVAVLFRAGVQVPAMLLAEVVGNAFNVAPAQMGPTCVKVGVVLLLICMVMVAEVAHCPAAGVNV